MISKKYDGLTVYVSQTEDEMGKRAAGRVRALLEAIHSQKETARVVFAAAPSQDSFIKHFKALEKIDWHRITAFHMDEYIGLHPGSPQAFGRFLSDRLFSKVPFGTVHLMDARTAEPRSECTRYANLLAAGPIDLVVMGIGENGHIAFNDPPVADFRDREMVKIVELDPVCRQQQVNDGAFSSIEDVPKTAMTMTVPALMGASHVVCIVPGHRKRDAVRAALEGPITTECPASVLRTHPDAALFLDSASSPL